MPQCLQQLLETPPISIVCQKDLDTIQVLRDVGNERQHPEYEILQATNLASGLSDIVVILLRPRSHENHRFDVDFNDFVRRCDTLKVVDELIRFASNGTRSIHTVTVLNACSYQPLDKEPTLDKQSEAILARILQIKKPKVIIQCHNHKYTDPWMERFNFGQGPYRLQRKPVEISDDHSAIVIPSFHPSHAVNFNEHRPELQILLVYHFVDAFRALKDKLDGDESPRLPCCAQEILELCHREPRALSTPLASREQEAAFRVAWLLQSSYHGPAIEAPHLSQIPADDGEEAQEQVQTFDALAFWLTAVFHNPRTFNLSGLVRASFSLQKFRLTSYPAYERLRLLFLDSTAVNAHWFCNNIGDAVTGLSSQFSDLGLSESSEPSLILQENNRAFELALKAASILNESPARRIKQRDHLSYYNAVYYQDGVIAGYIRDHQNTHIDQAIRIQTLSIQCRIFADSLFNSSRKNAESLTLIQQKDCFSDLLSCLTKLKNEFE